MQDKNYLKGKDFLENRYKIFNSICRNYECIRWFLWRTALADEQPGVNPKWEFNLKLTNYIIIYHREIWKPVYLPQKDYEAHIIKPNQYSIQQVDLDGRGCRNKAIRDIVTHGRLRMWYASRVQDSVVQSRLLRLPGDNLYQAMTWATADEREHRRKRRNLAILDHLARPNSRYGIRSAYGKTSSCNHESVEIIGYQALTCTTVDQWERRRKRKDQIIVDHIGCPHVACVLRTPRLRCVITAPPAPRKLQSISEGQRRNGNVGGSGEIKQYLITQRVQMWFASCVR